MKILLTETVSLADNVSDRDPLFAFVETVSLSNNQASDDTAYIYLVLSNI